MNDECNKHARRKDKESTRTSCMSQEVPEYRKSRIEVSKVPRTFNCQIRGLNRTGQADSPVISEYTDLKNLLVEGRGKKKYRGRQCKLCAAHQKRRETRNICKFCVPLHTGPCFEKYHSVTNYQTIYIQFLQSGAQEHNLQCQTMSKNMLWG